MKFGLQEPIKCRCGRIYNIQCDASGWIKGLDCTCGEHISVSGPLVKLPATYFTASSQCIHCGHSAGEHEVEDGRCPL